MKDLVLVINKEMEEIAKNLDIELIIAKNIIMAKDDKFNRNFIEKNKNKIIFDVESGTKDSFNQRDSGLNEVLCVFMNKNNISLGFSFKRLLSMNVLIIGQIMQNIRLCRKYKVKMRVSSLASSWNGLRAGKDIIALARALGMTPLEAKNSLE